MNRISLGGNPLPSQTRGDIVARACDVSTDSIGEKALYLNQNNKIQSVDIRSGYLLKEIGSGVPRVGAAFDRSAEGFVTAEFTGGKWWAIQYSYLTLLPVTSTDLSVFGVTSVNSCRYSVSSRYILIGHSTGTLLLDTKDYTAAPILSPLTGNIVDYFTSPNDFSTFTLKANEFQINQINGGRKLEYFRTGPVTIWDEVHCAAYNWKIDDDEQLYPDLFVAGKIGSQYRIHSYSVRQNSFTDDGLDWVFPERVVAMAYSQEATTDSGAKLKTKYGSALAVFGTTQYKVYNVTNGELLDSFTYTNLSQATTAIWGQLKGPYI